MITDPTTLKASGLPIGDLPPARMESAIREAEYDTILPAVGDDNYTALLTATGAVIDGGVLNGRHIVGFKAVANYLAFARLLRHTINATNFGSVQKRDEHSSPADPFVEGKYYETVGVQWLRDCCEAMGWPLLELRTYYTVRL